GKLRNVLQLADVEDSFDSRLVRARANEIGAGALAEQEAQCSDDDRLPGARFSRENVEAGRERKCHLLDDCEIADAQLGQHQPAWSRSGNPPHPSFTLIRSKNVAPGKRTIRTGLSAFLTLSFSPFTKLVPTCPSTVTRSSVGVSFASTVTSASAGMTSERMARVCGEIGVMTIDSTVGTTTGPPAERL